MIGRFPRPLPDETLYSVLARYGAWMGAPSPMALRRHLWGSTRPVASTLPNRLAFLVARLPRPSALSPEILLEHHTVFPYFRPFLSPERGERAAAELVADRTDQPQALKLRSHPGAPRPRGLRYCLGCFEEDRQQHGEAYWRRAHQLPGVWVCFRHRDGLWEFAPSRPATLRQAYHALSPAVAERGELLEAPEACPEVLQALAERSAWLLEAGAGPAGPRVLPERYRRFARARGWVDRRGQTAVRELAVAARLRHATLLYEALGVRHDWLACILKAGDRSPPVRHLLVLDLLDVDMASILGPSGAGEPEAEPARPRRTRPVREGPCRLPVCQRYTEERPAPVPDSERMRHQVPVTCPTCGFQYEYQSDAPDRWAVRALGPLWQRVVTEHLEAGGTKRALARKVGMSEATLRAHLKRVGIPLETFPVRRDGGPTSQSTKKRTRRRHRARLGRLLRDHPTWNRRRLHEAAPAAYEWLRRNDADWLEARLPAMNRARTDWAERDAELTLQVPEAAARALAAMDEPKLLSRKAVREELGLSCSALRRKLPRTAAAIEAARAEANVGHHARRLAWLEAQHREAGRVPPLIALAQGLGFHRRADAEAHVDLEAARERIRGAVEERGS